MQHEATTSSTAERVGLARRARNGARWAALLCAPDLALQALGSPYTPLLILPILLGLFALGSVPCALLWLISPNTRPSGLAWICWMGAFGVTAWLGVAGVYALRTWTFDRAGRRAKPLISAIERFDRERGAPPPSLDALVPGYLERVPATGLWAYSAFEYAVPDPAWGPDVERWVLSVQCSCGMLNWDQFIYYPSGDYSGPFHGGTTERIGAWVYFHE